MATKTKKIQPTASPKGVARFPHLRKARQFQKNGVPTGAHTYSVELVLPVAEWEAFKARAQELGEARAEQRGITLTGPLELVGFKPLKEGDQVVSDRRVVSFKMRRDHVSKKTGEEYQTHPQLIQANGAPLPESVDVTPGSEIQVAWTPYVWEMTDTRTQKPYQGLTMTLEAVMVHALAPKGGGRSAAELGFAVDPSATPVTAFTAEAAADDAGDTDGADGPDF